MALAVNPWVPEDSFGARLLRLRRHLGLTAKEIALKCNLNRATWSTWENDASPRDMAKIVRQIHDATGVDMAWLMWGVTPNGGGGSPFPSGDDTPPDLPIDQSRCTALHWALEEAA